MRKAVPLLCLLPLLALSACSLFEGEGGGEGDDLPPGVVLVEECCGDDDDLLNEAYDVVAWHGDDIYSAPTLTRITVDEEFHSVRQAALRDSMLAGQPLAYGDRGASYVTVDRAGGRLLAVRTRYAAASAGALYLIDLQTLRPRLLVPEERHVSTAVFLPAEDGGPEERILFYQYGAEPERPTTGPTDDAGYYALDLATREDSLVLRHRSQLAVEEAWNGFDVSPDGQTLIYPWLQATQLHNRSPYGVIRYDIPTGQTDTTAIAFPEAPSRDNVHLRYHPEGRAVLYVLYSADYLSHVASGPSEMGVLDPETGVRAVLEADTVPGEVESVMGAPTWSPDGRHVAYGSGPIFRDGRVGNHSLYVLRNAEGALGELGLQ